MGALSSGWYPGVNYQPADTYDGKRYDAWGNDYIWVPSGVETGWNNYLRTTSIWKLSSAQRKHSETYSWLRTGSFNSYGYAQTINYSSTMEADYNDSSNGVRPAIHLNLSEAAKYISKEVNAPESVVISYDGLEHGIENEDWFTSVDLGSNATIKYYEKGSTEEMSSNPKTVGEYEVEITLNNDTRYFEIGRAHV